MASFLKDELQSSMKIKTILFFLVHQNELNNGPVINSAELLTN